MLPTGLVFVVLICVIVLLVTLITVFAMQVSPIGSVRTRGEIVLAALAGAVGPILVAYTIAMNHAVSRWLILGNLIALIVLAAVSIEPHRVDRAWFFAASGAGVTATALWLFASRRCRLYYLLIRGRELPPELGAYAQEIASKGTGPLMSAIRAAGPWLELAGIVLVFLGVAIAVWIMQ